VEKLYSTCFPASRCRRVDDIHAHHAAVRGEPLGEEVEIAAVARKTVHAHHDVRIVVIAPLGIAVAVEAAVAQGKKIFLAHGKSYRYFCSAKKDCSAIRLTESKCAAPRRRAHGRKTDPHIIGEQKPVSAGRRDYRRPAAKLMKRHRHRRACWSRRAGRLAGISSERDALFRVLAEGPTRRRPTCPQVMTPNPAPTSRHRPFGHALHLMYEGEFRHVPVVENGSRSPECRRASARSGSAAFVADLGMRNHIGGDPGMKLRDVLAAKGSRVVRCRQVDIADAIRTMCAEKVGAVLVPDAEACPVGIIHRARRRAPARRRRRDLERFGRVGMTCSIVRRTAAMSSTKRWADDRAALPHLPVIEDGNCWAGVDRRPGQDQPRETAQRRRRCAPHLS